MAGVKRSEAGEAKPSADRLEVRPMETLAVGWEVSTTVKAAVPPASVVVRPLMGVTVNPAKSLLVLETWTSAALRPL